MSYSAGFKRKKFSSANPVFEEWLSELKEDAVARDLHSKHTFSKCLNSLRKYPLPLKSGKDCIILEGFGDKICKLIDEKLEVYLKEGGKLHDDEDIEILDECENHVQFEEESKKSKAKKNKKKPSEECAGNNNNCSELDSVKGKYPNLLKSSNSKTRIIKTKSWSKNSSDEEQEPAETVKKPRKNVASKDYLPEFRSGAYALLITLLKNEDEQDEINNYLLKSQLIKEAQKHSDAQFVSHDPKNHYTAWNSMSNLIKKNLVLKENKLPARYRLTDTGRELAKRLWHGSSDSNENETIFDLDKETFDKKKKKSNDNEDCIEIEDLDKITDKNTNYCLVDSSDSEKLEDIGCSTGLSQQFFESKIADFPRTVSNSDFNSIRSQLPIQDQNTLFTLLPGSYDIILFIDNCETNAKKQDLLIDEIKKSGIKHEFGKLHVGDFTWIARSKNASQTDLVLDYIVERKRMDDFCSSIIDGRYKEQKFRLKKSGIRHSVYLIEDYGSMKHMSLPEKSLVQADVNTQIIDKLVVHHSTDPKDSAYYLIHMSKFLMEKFKNRKLCAIKKGDMDNFSQSFSDDANQTYLMTFKEFNEFSNKNKPLSVKEMFAKCLMKIQGLSQEKVLAIIDLYPTPAQLFKEYSKCSDENSRIKLLANVKYGAQQRNIGPAVSKIIAQLFYTSAPLP